MAATSKSRKLSPKKGEGKNPPKLERCVRAVAKKGKVKSAHAVCKAALAKTKPNGDRQKEAKQRFLKAKAQENRGGKIELTRQMAWAAATDAGNRSMRKAGRTAWSRVDYNVAAREFTRLWGKKANPAGGFSVVQGKAHADVKPEGPSAWVVYIRGDKPKEFKSVEAAAKYARLRVHEAAPRQNARSFPGKKALTKLARKLKLSNPRRNPEESAAQMYHIFHGKPATQVLEFVQREHVHEWLWAAGTLVSLEVVNGSQQMKLCAPDPQEADLEDVVMVGFSEDGRQAYFVGGDQDIDLDALMEKFSMTEDDIRDHMKLGQVKKLTYRTSKNFEEGGREDIDFYHALGKEHSRGVLPDLVFKPLNPSMELVGGRYFVAPKDSQLGASPGVVG